MEADMQQRARETHLVSLRASPTVPWQGLDSSEATENQVPTPDELKSLILSFLIICRPANLKVVNLEAFDHKPESEDGEQVHGPVAVMVEQLMKEELEASHRKAIQESVPEAHSSWLKTRITYLTLEMSTRQRCRLVSCLRVRKVAVDKGRAGCGEA